MAEFVFDIKEVVDGETQCQHGGQIDVDEVRITQHPRFYLVEADGDVTLLPHNGGTVHLTKLSPGDESLRETRRRNLVGDVLKIILILLFGFGFVVIIWHDLRGGGTLNFEKYMSIIAAFMGGLGAASLGK